MTTPLPSSVPVKFLLVDDVESNLVALELLLRRPGLEVLKARSGSEALELLLAHEVALALVDVDMPGMDGFELAELMRGTARTRAVPIIFVTGHVTDEHRIFQGYDAGAVDFLHKPIDERILRHKAETFYRLERQRLQLAETLRMSELFVAAVGHDLRNPLSAMMMAAALLESRVADEPSRQIVRRLLGSGRRMARIVDDLFDLARARLGGGIPVEKETADLSAIVTRVVSEHRQAHPQRVVEVHASGNVEGRWDPVRLAQVVSNLIGNAEEHGTDGTPITFTLAGRDDDVVLSIHNAGAIRPEALPQLFDPFRGHTQTARKGLGLGLYIVDQIVAAHGGGIEVASSPEAGTTFHVRLPRRASDPPPSAN
jgi:signal transduction histidine kinase